MHGITLFAQLFGVWALAAALELNDYRVPTWTAQSLEEMFEVYSKVIGCDVHDTNSSCAEVSYKGACGTITVSC